MNGNPVKLSVVIPVYNAEKHIEKTIVTLVNFFNGHSINYEIVLIDDNSTDGTFQILNSLPHTYPAMIVDRNHENIGQDRSILKGIKLSSNDPVLIIDDDFEYSVDSLSILFNAMHADQCDLVYGIPKQKKTSAFRRIGSRWIHRTVEWMGYSLSSNYKLMSGKLIGILKETPDSKFFSLEKVLFTSAQFIQYVSVDNIPDNNTRFTFNKLLTKYLKFIFYQTK